MKKRWEWVLPQVVENFDKINQIKCPECGKYEIDYIYIGDGDTRIGFLEIWCNNCLKGIHVSRAIAPSDAKFETFDTDLNGIVPKFEYVWS